MKFSLITCSNNIDYYTRNVVASTAEWTPKVELVVVDNQENRFSLPEALNHGMGKATGDVLIFCHHDIIFPSDWLPVLETQIQIVESMDAKWGVIGAIGVRANGQFAGHIRDPHTHKRMGNLPCVVESLDEVCLLVRRNSELRFDEELGGHHFYGADICLAARRAGMKCYAVDAPLQHLSGGNRTDEFYQQATKLKAKWSRIPRSPLTIETTCGVFILRDSLTAKFTVAYKKIRRRVRRRLRT